MKTLITIIGACVLVMLVVGASSTVRAKIYVWEDADGRVHYVSDPEEVPQRILDDEKKYRVIETTIVPSAANPGQPQGSSETSVRTAVTPPSVPTSQPGTEAAGELQTLQTSYRNLLQNMREFRKNNKDLNHPQYREMQQQVLDLRRKMAEARNELRKK